MIVREVSFLSGASIVPSRDIADAKLDRLRKGGEEMLLVSCADSVDDARAALRLIGLHGKEAWRYIGASQVEVETHFQELAETYLELMSPGLLVNEIHPWQRASEPRKPNTRIACH